MWNVIWMTYPSHYLGQTNFILVAALFCSTSICITYPNVVNGEVVFRLGTLHPAKYVVDGISDVRIRVKVVPSEPARPDPWQTVQQDGRVSLVTDTDNNGLSYGSRLADRGATKLVARVNAHWAYWNMYILLGNPTNSYILLMKTWRVQHLGI